MKEKYTAYLPIWFVLMLPPMVFLLIGWNFIMCGIGLMVGLLIIGLPDGFIKYSKNIFKLWGISILLDVITFIFLLVPEILSKIDFFNKNLVSPLEYNPYSKVFSAVYIIFLFLIILFLAYKLINKFIIKGINGSKTKVNFMKFVIIISVLPYLLFIPSTFVLKPEKNNLEDFKGTILGNKSDVVTVMKYLSVSKYIDSYVLDTHTEPYSINLYLDTIDVNYMEKFEMDAATIFNLIEDVNTVNYTMNGVKYSYSINKINKIFDDVKNTDINDVLNRYTNSNFTDYIYLDHIGKYDLFDMSEACEETNQRLFTYNGNTYYLECSSLKNIMLFYNNEEIMNLETALSQRAISEDNIIESLLPIKTDEELHEDISN